MMVVALFVGSVIWLSLRREAPKTGSPAVPAVPAATPEEPAPTGPAEERFAPPGTPAEALPGPAPVVEDRGGGCYRIGRIDFDQGARTITIPAAVHMREGPVEYLLVTRQGKVHETVFVTDADPRDIHVAALLLGVRPQPDLGPPDAAVEVGDRGAVTAWVEWERNGPPARVPLNEVVAVADPATGGRRGTLPGSSWLYNGSAIAGAEFLASKVGSIVSIIRDPEALVNNPGASRDNDEIHTPNAGRLPKLEHPVRIVLKVP